MRLHRFYVLQPLGEEVVINDVSQIFQWTKVFRYEEGDFVILFNGDGYDYCYSITTITKKLCSLTRTKQTLTYIPTQKITLCLSVIKKDNFELAVQKATELGVTKIIPILSERSEKKGLSYERLEKIAIEASEQCGRGDVPLIAQITALEDALTDLTPSQKPFLLEKGGKSLILSRDSFDGKEAVLFIGPEGGWGPGDIEHMKKYEVGEYSLGNTVLRAETAAIMATGILSI